MSIRVLAPVVLAVAALTAAVGVFAREVYQRPDPTGAGELVTGSAAVPRADEPGTTTVQLTVDAASHPDGPRVRDLLQQYFDALNAHDFAAWTGMVTPERLERADRDRWLADYDTTRNGSVVVRRLETTTTDRLRVMITFTSTQDVAKAPPALPVDCIRWRVVYPLRDTGAGLRVDAGTEGLTSQYSPC
ncbi:hypothetical protein [Saccharothrix violaceirubra]|uniref:Uncharacterized protein n=1 Tax=Saccharothrix violaceirubra TaxID=413306 RepID=A0A7W7T739_9PSEU|nr:hypothetical protein [Saccharothrix violaceirubra]MBB4967783.1 hypothetical protein [Saccharothrix violaceirubra]